MGVRELARELKVGSPEGATEVSHTRCRVPEVPPTPPRVMQTQERCRGKRWGDGTTQYKQALKLNPLP